MSSVLDGGSPAPRVLITGGAGFVGTNLAARLVQRGVEVQILDSLARAGSEQNIQWLIEHFPQRLEFTHGDVRDDGLVASVVRGVDHIFHLAAQVAVTTSLTDPQQDFAINARGTLNILEAARARSKPPSIVFSSTNKVYGALADVGLHATGARYEPVDHELRRSGIGETRALEFHSPYGCSKGAAEQYVLDYARSYGLRTVVLRMSCIYGPHQHGNEDQGWVAHFMRRALADEPVTVYGDGMQVRDILFVGDLLDAFELAWHNADALSGRAFNIGGGAANTVSILELLEYIESITQRAVPVSFDDWRTGDQRYYVSDTRRFNEATAWKPRTSVNMGLAALAEWLQEHASFDEPLQRLPRDGASAITSGPQP